MRKPTQRELDAMRVNPNPRLVWLMNYALDEVVAKLHDQSEFREWLEWAAAWKDGQRSPQACVDISQHCREQARLNGLVWPTLAQLAWGAKEACYSAPTSGWLVIGCVADAMHAFGVAFPDKAATLLEPPTIVDDQPQQIGPMS